MPLSPISNNGAAWLANTNLNAESSIGYYLFKQRPLRSSSDATGRRWAGGFQVNGGIDNNEFFSGWVEADGTITDGSVDSDISVAGLQLLLQVATELRCLIFSVSVDEYVENLAIFGA